VAEEFPRRLRQAREAKRMSPYRLAQLTGLSKQGVLNLEQAGADPKLSTIVLLAQVLDISPRELLPMAAVPKQADICGVHDVRDAARHIYNRLKPTLASLKHLLGCDRSTFAPDLIAGDAQVLEREIKALFKLLAGIGREE
jgi:transcriptional regulator with XRE-family HTH domain